MAFKFAYDFEGNAKSRPEQNLSGSGRKLPRDLLIQRTQEERRKRQEQRLRLQSAELLQSHIRSFLVRKRIKSIQRQEYDALENELDIFEKLRRLLFFYDPSLDFIRLCKFAQLLLYRGTSVPPEIEWPIKRLLALCMKHLRHPEATALMLNVVTQFSDNSDVINYLLRKGYYEYLRDLLDHSSQEALPQVTFLINRPFRFLSELRPSQDFIFSEFCDNFLKKSITTNIVFHLFPYLREKSDTSFYDKLVRYLNSVYLTPSNSLFYCLLALEPVDYEPCFESIHVLSLLSKDLHLLNPSLDLSEDSDDDDDEDVAEESLGEVSLSSYLTILNNFSKVRKWLSFFESHENDELILLSFVDLAQNLLLVYKDSMRKYFLLYKLGLNDLFLKHLWSALYKKYTSCRLQVKAVALSHLKEYDTLLSVFCDMFTFYTETLTDKENSDTSDTFTQSDLYNMSHLLKSIALDLIEIAFPICRVSSETANAETTHLYRSCLNCLKMLHTLDMRRQFCPPTFWTSRRIHLSPDMARKNYLSKPTCPFGLSVPFSEDEERLPPLSTIEQRSLAVLQELPFLVPFSTRVQLLRDFCRYSIGDNEYQRMHRDLMSDNTVVIRRNYLYEDAFEKISTKSESDMKNRVRVQFINNVGLEEAGVDGGGLFKEFINEVLKTAFDPNRGFFLMTADNTLYPNPHVNLIVDNYVEHYRFIGRLVGKAIFENILVDLPLAEFFLSKLLVERASACYLKSLDPVLYRNLLYLRDYSGDVSDLGLDFTTVSNDLGETKVVDLKPNGRNIQVTNENRLEYIQRLADLKLNGQLKKQCAAFREGLNGVVPLLWLKLFNYRELQVVIGGDMQEVNLDDLRTHTVYSGVFNEEHPTIQLFWKILYGFTDVQKRQLLKFVTSCSRPPLLGFKELNPQFCIQSSGTESRMPTASTCLNLLKIPIVKNEEDLRAKLLGSIEQQAGFELS